MTLEKHENFAENLRNLRASKNLSLVEFAEELDIPKSTLQPILETGQTTLNTAIQISDRIGIPLDTLTSYKLSEKQINMMDRFMHQFEWYSKLPKLQQEEANFHASGLMKLILEMSYE